MTDADRPVRYYVEPSKDAPTILVRVTGLLTADRLIPGQDWAPADQLSYWAWDSSGIPVTPAEAAAIADGFGARL